MAFQWTCPYCDRDTTITDGDTQSSKLHLNETPDGPRYFATYVIVCPNPSCRKFTLGVAMWDFVRNGPGWAPQNLLQEWSLLPPSRAKVYPEYIPQPIRDDYTEACLIVNLSPKAAATLARRCLQGMIRDYWNVVKARLIDEIETIKDRVDPLTWAAIDAVRSIGNIGAHMEKDISLIIDVEPGEAEKLLELVELLLKDWYITRHQREEHLKAIVAIKGAKDAQKAAAGS